MPHRRYATAARGAKAVALAAVPISLFLVAPARAQSTGNRLLGLDVSAHQGSWGSSQWNGLFSEGRRFVFVRSSRGGTTGEDHRQGGYPSEGYDSTTFRLSQRYDDKYYVINMNSAVAAGYFAGSYHFSRPDVLATTLGSDGVPAGVDNSGTDEADHFIQMAGPFMRPGYLPPVHDFEAGDGVRTDQAMAQFALDFSNRIYQVMQIRPAIYVNGNYAANILEGANSSTQAQLAQQPSVRPTVTSPAYPTLWSARWPNQADPASIQVQTAHPKDSYTPIYGPWDNYGITHPWAFWQYASTWRSPSYNNGNSNLDVDVAQGGVEFVKDQLIPALWWNDASGDWSTLANWNSGQTPVLPPHLAGQLTPVSTTLPTPRLPGVAGPGTTTGLNDTVILERPNANITVTLSSGSYDIRKLYMREALNITGGTLNINYTPVVPESSAMSAQISGAMTLGGTGALSVHTLWVDATKSFTVSGGTLTFNTIDLKQSAPGPAGAFLVTGNPTFAGWLGGTATLTTSAGPGGSGPTGVMNLSSGNRTITVNNGAADVDLQVNVPITSGQLTKAGTGTMALGAADTFTGAMTLNDGIVRVSAPNQLNGVSGIVANITVTLPGSAGHGGTLQLVGNNSYNIPMTLNGGGLNGVSFAAPGITGALDSMSGTNTWAGAITLAGAGANGSDPTINQVSATGGATLVLSNVIQDAVAISATLAKSGDGDVVLTGGSANTYSNLTRVYGGRLIIEKNGALGAAGSSTLANGNTFQLGGSNSTIAFRAPGASPGINYTTYEWINIDGNGNAGLGELDNLSGANTFAGHIGLNGPTVSGVIQSTIGVSAGSLELSGGLYTRGAAGVRNITKIGAGILILSGDSGVGPSNTLNGSLLNSTFNVNGGTVALNGTGTNTANVPGVTTWNIAGTLALNGDGALGSPTVNLQGGIIQTNVDQSISAPITVAAGGGTLASAGHNASFSGALTGSAALVKSNAGTTSFTGPVSSFTGGLTINAGTFAVAPNGGASRTMRLASLSINPAAALDLNDNDLAVEYSGASVFTTLQSYVVNGYASLPTPGLTGIISSTGQSAGNTILALIDNAFVGTPDWPVGSGNTVDATSVLGKYTYFGDMDLDGQVSAGDYGVLDANLGSTPAPGAAWISGDADFDGTVTNGDYGILDANLGAGVGNPLAPAAAVVPEPASLVAIASIGLAMRRRTRKPRI